MMGGVDRSNQMMNSYPAERKRLKKWYKKMWIHLINSCVSNAHILHKKKGGKLTSLEFHTKFVSQIIEKYGEDTENYRHGGRPSTTDNPFQLVDQHFPSYIPPTEKKLMPPNGVLFVENVVSKKNHNMNVLGVMQYFALHLILKFITKLRYFKCYC